MRTSCVVLVIAAVLCAAVFTEAGSSLLISEMCDPHLHYSTDRFIEIYNAGNEAVDLTGWSLVAVGNNGDIFAWNLSGLVDPGDALVAGDATTVTDFPVDFPDEDWSDNNGLWNGKIGDGAKLLAPGSVLIDYAVVTGTHFENDDYVRNYGVTEPNTTYTLSEWTATPVEHATDGSPGTHYTAPPIPGPSICCVRTTPEFPFAGEDVNVLADVTDTTVIISVVLFWGTTASSLPNEIVMSVAYGDTYMTDSLIPSQPEGVTIYFQIEATNDLSGTSESDLESYSLPFDVAIYEIQGNGPTSPYNGEAVLTHGVVTARYDSYFVMQDGVGSWNGIWVASSASVSIGDSLVVLAEVTESYGFGQEDNTLLMDAQFVGESSGAALPMPVVIATSALSSEEYEGVLVAVQSAACTNPTLGYGEWELDDGSGAGRANDLGYDFTPTLGTSYDVIGPVTYSFSHFKVEPRDEGDVVWAGDNYAPIIVHVAVMSDTGIVVAFSEEVEETTAQAIGNYTIEDLDVLGATLDETYPDQVLLTVSVMSVRDYTITVDGVEDLLGNTMIDVGYDFRFVSNDAPGGYYDSAGGLFGEELKAELHQIIESHTVYSYDYAWSAFRTTDVKPNGKVWDVYSDVPGGTPPYEYTFGVDEGGIGGREGEGYTREHSWPRSWFGGEVSPMNSDLFALYPCDAHVNGNRGSYPYGEVTSPEWVSLNGSMRGASSYPGYSGVVFEPIDEYKGDLARTYFYMSTRYYEEDADWPGSPMTDGAELLPWAVSMLLEWHAEDSVGQKEVARNSAIYALQHNRNPFIDEPEFAQRVFGAASSTECEVLVGPAALDLGMPNPFGQSTTMRFAIPTARDVVLTIFDVRGREVAVLASGRYQAGEHAAIWDGRDAEGRPGSSGIYFALLQAGDFTATKRLVLLR